MSAVDSERGLRLLLVADRLDARGSASLAIDLARQLKSAGHSVLLVDDDGPRSGEVRQAGVERRTAPSGRRQRTALAAFRPDLVHALSLGAIPAALPIARDLSVPFLLTVHGWPRDRHTPLDLDGIRPAAVIAVSDLVREHLVNRAAVPWDQVRVVEGAVDIRRLESSPPEVETPYAPVIGSAGALVAWRGHTHLLEAVGAIAAAHRDVRVVIAGDGPDESALRGRARQLEIEDRVLFVTGLASYERVVAEFDVFVSPALEEGLGQNVLVAMACAKPVVATNVGGVYRLVEDGKTGRLVRPRDADAIAGAVIEILADREAARAMGRAGRRQVEERYGLPRMATETEEVYRSVLEQG